ncbi:hypothetical protein J8C06_13760 [Chloracidobacterium validum]|uniref:Uncharacterized protein n=1 Tax=Chloracidobacterium validum TaxID=2821543 RepID=A0ABX8BCG9_9BACT|nr:hypothetical protein [Chloracidobacterium validum]QUW04112.1 hypothetical protein J8C06_13760 [Chloracidobacterium validum]
MTTSNLIKPAVHVGLGTALLLLVPLIAMQFTKEVSWGPGDFFAAALLLFASGMSYSLVAQRVRTSKQRAAVAVVVLAVLAVVWAELAVGLFD